MDNKRALLVAAVCLGVVISTASAYPLMNIVVYNNEGGWFTTESAQAYGEDLDSRVGPGEPVLTGHPTYLASAEEARLLFDMPRMQYYAEMWNDTESGDEFYRNLTVAIRNGTAQYAVHAEMLDQVLAHNATAQRAFERHYCRVPNESVQELYNETGATLYRWSQPDTCSQQRSPSF